MLRFDATAKACPLHSVNTRYKGLNAIRRSPLIREQNVSDAQRAITCGRGMMIDGRPCRTEVAKVNRKQIPNDDYSYRFLTY